MIPPLSTQPAQELAGRTAVVTGSSRGIGQAVALELAAAGARIIVHARGNQEEALATVQAIRKQGGSAEMILADLARPDEQNRLMDEAWNIARGVDILVNNAGVDVLTGAAARWPFEHKLAALWEVDVVATIRLSRGLGERMQARGHGVIINMGWDQATHGMGGASGEIFACVKGAVMAFTKSAAISLAPQVRVNCIAPGWIKTAWGEQASSAWQNRAQGECLLGRWGAPEDIAKAARFLSGDGAAFINGQVLPVNGGFRPTAFQSTPATGERAAVRSSDSTDEPRHG